MGGGAGEDAAGFDAGYYGKLLEKAWEEAGFVFVKSADVCTASTGFNIGFVGQS